MRAQDMVVREDSPKAFSPGLAHDDVLSQPN